MLYIASLMAGKIERGEEGFFSWLSEARLHYCKTRTGERRLKAVKGRLCDWLHRAILRDKQVLAYAAAYFQLGPIERRGGATGDRSGDLPPLGQLSEPGRQFSRRDEGDRPGRCHP